MAGFHHRMGPFHSGDLQSSLGRSLVTLAPSEVSKYCGMSRREVARFIPNGLVKNSSDTANVYLLRQWHETTVRDLLHGVGRVINAMIS